MNKYDERILEIASSGVIIHELLRRPIRSRLFQFIDTLLGGRYGQQMDWHQKGLIICFLMRQKQTLYI